ncbi:hypothetical protein [Plebeiibacterium marinum]|uniref:Outer membrane protein beta-barrel domain-containing protein n=1 Tax=Plebeiibacterium marinum TaxID=2992111 RepID=A0AAE3MI28_9BACT|nr:hypothetical protein [Plebeiobacterium marinum]MCW3807482.1 hypothetical protein [Plebeiobacterium marinum]
MTNLKLILILVGMVFSSVSFSQVEDIKSSIENDKHSKPIRYEGTSSVRSCCSHSSYSDDMDLGESLLAEIVFGVVKGVGFITIEAQRTALENRDVIPNLISMETTLDYGTTFQDITFNPSLRLNWGIFATDFRYALLHDNTGSLESLDWQMLVARIPVKNLKLNYGVGFTSIMSPKTSYFESSAGFDLNLFESTLNFNANYRWTERKSEKRYRQELKFTGDVEVLNNGRLHLSPMVGVTYQEYFNRDRYLLFNVGVKMRIF